MSCLCGAFSLEDSLPVLRLVHRARKGESNVMPKTKGGNATKMSVLLHFLFLETSNSDDNLAGTN